MHKPQENVYEQSKREIMVIHKVDWEIRFKIIYSNYVTWLERH